jgi:hypothetical protein
MYGPFLHLDVPITASPRPLRCRVSRQDGLCTTALLLSVRWWNPRSKRAQSMWLSVHVKVDSETRDINLVWLKAEHSCVL